MKISLKALEVLKGLLVAYLFTGIVLAILAFFVYKYDLTEQIVDISIIVTYIVANLLGGFIIGKKVKTKKFIWGILLGILYILIIYIASIAMNNEFNFISTANITVCVMCIGGGMLGGMLS